MSSDTHCLVLRLQGPLQAWGTESQYNRRTTGIFPSKSAVAGMLCSALGLHRGSEEEKVFLAELTAMPMLAVSVPRRVGKSAQWELTGSRMDDFHTVQGTAKAGGGTKNCHITRRQYLEDMDFRVFLSGSKTLEKLAEALQNPIWGVWLGRKCCVPAAPVFAGLFTDETTALGEVLDAPLEKYTHEREVDAFDKGTDSLADQAVCFLSANRRFSSRRVRRIYAAKAL